jgi:hypothetical protein
VSSFSKLFETAADATSEAEWSGCIATEQAGFGSQLVMTCPGIKNDPHGPFSHLTDFGGFDGRSGGI